MKDTMTPRREALIVHKHGLNAIASYMAMPIVPVEKLAYMPAPRRERQSLRARLRALLKSTA